MQPTVFLSRHHLQEGYQLRLKIPIWPQSDPNLRHVYTHRTRYFIIIFIVIIIITIIIVIIIIIIIIIVNADGLFPVN